MIDWKPEIRALLSGLNLEPTREAGIVEEISQHLEDRYAELRASGASEEEARRAGLEELRSDDFLARELRRVERSPRVDPVFFSQRKGSMMEEFFADLRYGARMLCKNPGFTAVAVLTLALGIGATTAIFSAVYGVVISPYPYARPGEIWVPGVLSAQRSERMRAYRLDEFRAISALPEFSETMGTSPGMAMLTGEFAPEMLTVPHLTLNTFQFLEVPPVLGRVFGPSDVSSAGVPEPVTVLSYRLWQRLFGGDAAAIGKTLRLDDQVYTIIGVMPPRFGWWTSDGLWLPMADGPVASTRIFPIVRLKQGIDPSAARQRLHALQLELAKINPAGFPTGAFESSLSNYLDMTVASGEMEKTLRMLFGAVSFLLLIACANVANLQLARATSRAREMAIRLSVGAGRLRLVRQLLTESVLLSLVGGLLGLACAFALTRLLVVLMPGSYVPNESRIELNGYVLWFCVLVSMLTGIVFGLVPAWQSSRPDLTEALKDEGRGSSSARGGVFRAGLVVAEVAMSVVLLVSAALTIRSFLALHNVDPGFRVDHVITVNLTLPAARYPTLARRNQFDQELLDRLEHLPGVEAVDLGNGGLPFGGPQSGCSIRGQADSASPQVKLNLVAADHLKTLGIRLLRGRMLDRDDISRLDHCAVINEAAAKLWPAGEDPLGRQISVDILKGDGSVLFPSNSSPEVTVIGVCADTRNDGLTQDAFPAVLVPYTLVAPPDRTLAVRCHGDMGALMKAVRGQIRQIDPQLPVGGMGTMEEALLDQSVQPRFTMVLFSVFAGFGLALAAAGIYCVLSYLVSRRTREIGVRMALGAQRGDVLGLILKDGGRLAGLGIVLGTLASIAAARLLASQIELFHVSATDFVSFAGVVLLLGIVCALACWLPARRATKVDPMEALRCD
jgi:putative ABC transport system permease protein